MFVTLLCHGFSAGHCLGVAARVLSRCHGELVVSSRFEALSPAKDQTAAERRDKALSGYHASANPQLLASQGIGGEGLRWWWWRDMRQVPANSHLPPFLAIFFFFKEGGRGGFSFFL